MPLKERQEYFSSDINNVKIFLIFFICLAILFLLIYIIKKVANKKYDKDYSTSKLLSLFFFMLLGIVSCIVSFIFHDYEMKNNKEDMHYVTINGKGTVNHIDTGTILGERKQEIRFDADGKNYYITIDENIAIATGDTIKVKSDKKIPTKDNENESNLGYYVPYIDVSVQHNGKWKKVNILKKSINNHFIFH